MKNLRKSACKIWISADFLPFSFYFEFLMGAAEAVSDTVFILFQYLFIHGHLKHFNDGLLGWNGGNLFAQSDFLLFQQAASYRFLCCS